MLYNLVCLSVFKYFYEKVCLKFLNRFEMILFFVYCYDSFFIL